MEIYGWSVQMKQGTPFFGWKLPSNKAPNSICIANVERKQSAHFGKMGAVMQPKNTTKILLILLLLLIAGFACSALGGSLGSAERSQQKLFDGVTYIKEVRTSPRRMVVHIVKVNVSKSSIQPLITPADRPDGGKPYNARTTTEFAKQNNVQLAINGHGFTPWYDYRFVYFPHSGDKVAPLGTVVSGKFEYIVGEESKFPLLTFGGGRPVDITYVLGNPKYAISGTRMLASNGQVEMGLNNTKADPRTAVGVSANGQEMIIVVVDGRQTGYSKGATLQELAQILVDHGADKALELDGGGSSTLVLNPKDGPPQILNSPIHQGIPGNERPVATHIGFKIK